MVLSPPPITPPEAPHCEICTTEPQDVVMSWINSQGEGKGGGMQFAALCDGCARTMWHKLSHYPAAMETVTIAPPGGPWHRQLMGGSVGR